MPLARPPIAVDSSATSYEEPHAARRSSHDFLVSKKLDEADNMFMRRVFKAHVAAHPILGGIATSSTEHGGPIRNVVTGPAPVDTAMVMAVAEVSFSIADIEQPNFSAYKRFIDDIVEQIIGAQLTHMFDTIGKITNAVGNVTDGNGELTMETFRESIRKVDIDFDENGRAQLPQLIVPPEARERAEEVVAQANHDAELARIIAEKRAMFLARQRKRRLY